MEDESDEVLPVLATLGFSEAFGGVGAVTVGAAGAAGLTTAEGSLGFGGGFALNEGVGHFDLQGGPTEYPPEIILFAVR